MFRRYFSKKNVYQNLSVLLVEGKGKKDNCGVFLFDDVVDNLKLILDSSSSFISNP